MEKTGLVIVNFNGGTDLFHCIRSLATHVQGYPLLVIDNNSQDGSARTIKEQEPTVAVIELTVNEGYGAAMNRGFLWARKKGLDSVILLNHDVFATDDFVTPLTKNSADLVGPVVAWQHKGEITYDLGGKILWPFGRTVHIQTPYRPPAYNRRIDYLPGCCLKVTLEAAERLSGFDPKFFLYFEDVDLCFRARIAGLKVAVEPKACIMHKVSVATGGKHSPVTIYYCIRNNLFFIWKYADRVGKVVGTGYVGLLSLWILSRSIARGSFTTTFRALMAAWVDALTNTSGHRAGYP